MIMPISKKHYPEIIFLIDLDLQCKLFERSFHRLETAAEHWINLCNGIDDGIKFSPLEIISECTVCLSAMSAIKRIIVPTNNSSKKRGRLINELLNEPDLENIFTTKVRNSWEHHDERLDIIFSNQVVNTGIHDIYVSTENPKENTTILRRFDPTNLSIHFSGDIIQLKPCIFEIQNLQKEITNAFARLSNESQA